MQPFNPSDLDKNVQRAIERQIQQALDEYRKYHVMYNALQILWHDKNIVLSENEAGTLFIVFNDGEATEFDTFQESFRFAMESYTKAITDARL